ncbi:MAG: lipoyl synthase [Candidatus Aenigmarchaeota archaeon]|nr:lipoyl synthase [Candidatus Aenigmarchaeota archaeon]
MAIATRGKPSWLKIKIPEKTRRILELREILREHGMVTVCEEAHCPNIPECWNGGTATFMVLGDTCTRGCRFCNVAKSRNPLPVNSWEPKMLAMAVRELKLDYVVITSVDRDDLPDQGSGHFAECIRAVKEQDPNVIVEVLIPDFRGDIECLKKVIGAEPNVIAHNIETIRRLQSKIRDRRAGYEQSLQVLSNVKKMDSKIFTKSSIIVGFGETQDEVVGAMKDLRGVNVDFLTVGQYLRPSSKHIEVSEFIPPEKFEFYKKYGEKLGFKYVASGPFVRTSYRAGEFFTKSIIRTQI